MRNFIVTVLLLAVPALCTAEIYKWVDEKGQTGFSDDLGKVPKKYRDNAAVTEKQDQAVEIIENSQPDKSVKKGADGKGSQTAVGAEKSKGKDAPLFDGKDGAAWKQDFARQKYELKSLEDQAAGIKERMADAGKLSRGEYLALQNTARDFDVRIGKARKKLEALTEAAENAGVPGEFR